MVVTGLEFLRFKHITLKLRVLTGYNVVMVTFCITKKP